MGEGRACRADEGHWEAWQSLAGTARGSCWFLVGTWSGEANGRLRVEREPCGLGCWAGLYCGHRRALWKGDFS